MCADQRLFPPVGVSKEPRRFFSRSIERRVQIPHTSKEVFGGSIATQVRAGGVHEHAQLLACD